MEGAILVSNEKKNVATCKKLFQFFSVNLTKWELSVTALYKSRKTRPRFAWMKYTWIVKDRWIVRLTKARPFFCKSSSIVAVFFQKRGWKEVRKRMKRLVCVWGGSSTSNQCTGRKYWTWPHFYGTVKKSVRQQASHSCKREDANQISWVALRPKHEEHWIFAYKAFYHSKQAKEEKFVLKEQKKICRFWNFPPAFDFFWLPKSF